MNFILSLDVSLNLSNNDCRSWLFKKDLKMLNLFCICVCRL